MTDIAFSRRGLMLGGLSLAGLAACSPKPAASGDLSNLSLRVATYRGNPESFFDKAGIAPPPYKLVRTQFAGGNLIAEAINARALDFGGMSEIPPIFVAGHPGNLVRIVGVLRGDVNNQVVLVPKGSPVQDFAQLKGKRIGYVKATTSHYILLRLLAKAGLTWADITPVALSPQDGLAAFQSGALDAWIIYGVIVYQAREAGARVLTNAQGILSGNYLITAAQEALDDPIRLKAIGDYVQRYKKVFDWINADGVRWAQRPHRGHRRQAGLLRAGVQGAQLAVHPGAGQRRGHRFAAGRGRHLRRRQGHSRNHSNQIALGRPTNALPQVSFDFRI